jgi:hypothetical protein
MNWYVRSKLALTEDEPLVRPYDERRWAELHDTRTGPLEPSLMLLDRLHRRWDDRFRSLTEEQWKRQIIHPDRGVFVLDATLPMPVWHGRPPYCPHRGVTKPHGLEITPDPRT